MKNIFILAFTIISICIPFKVNAEDVPFEFPCEFIPNKSWVSQSNNGSHNNDSSYYWITDKDFEEVYTDNAYKIGDKYYRSTKLRNISQGEANVFSLQLELYPNTYIQDSNHLLWNSEVAWQPNRLYAGYIMLGSLNDNKFNFAGGSSSAVSRVGPLPKGSDYFSRPQDYSSKGVMKRVFYKDTESNMHITMLPFTFRSLGKDAQNKLVFTLQSESPLSGNDVYILGFALTMPSVNGDFSNVPNDEYISYEELNNFRNSFRASDECYSGSYDLGNDDNLECNGTIDCAIKKVESTFSEWINSLLDFLSKLFIPNGERFSNMATDFMDWFDTKLGFLGQPITFTVDFLNRFLNLTDSGIYVLEWSDWKVPILNLTIIPGNRIDLGRFLENEKIKRVHDITFVIINGSIGIAFLMLCGKKLDDVFGQSHYDTGETLTEHEGYQINDSNGVVKKNS